MQFNTTSDASRIALNILAVTLIGLCLYWTKQLLIPICYGLLLAMILYPVCKRLEKHHFPRALAIAAGLAIVSILLIGLAFLMITQLRLLFKEMPALALRLKPLLTNIDEWIEATFGVQSSLQAELQLTAKSNLTSYIGILTMRTLPTASWALLTLCLIPVYAALFLYNRETFMLFVAKVTPNRYRHYLDGVLPEIVNIYFNFVRGMVMVYIVVGLLNSAGLLLLGIPHAILFGMLTSIMTIIPYFGIIISASLPITVAYLTKGSLWYPAGVIGVFTIVQYLEANIIFPRIVGRQLGLNTWSTLVAAIAGGMLWDISGLILFVPLLGMVKIVSEQIPEWEAVNILLRSKPAKKHS